MYPQDMAEAPYGSWRSPITAALRATGTTPLREARLVGETAYWLQGRPQEGGRLTLVRLGQQGEIQELTPAPTNVRTRVHEYGGGAYLPTETAVYYVDFADQRVYRLDPGSMPCPITPAPEIPSGARYADFCLAPGGRLLLAVRELYQAEGDPKNEIVAIPTDGAAPPRVVVTGADFYSFPRVTPDGRQLAWTSWMHPRMPWDGTDLWVGDLAPDGSVMGSHHVAGGPEESIFQPAWSPEGVLHFVSDRTGWWNLYRLRGATAEPLAPLEAEFGAPQWVFAQSTYAFLPGGRIACIVTRDGLQRLSSLAGDGSPPVAFELPYTAFGNASLHAHGDVLLFIAGAPAEPAAVVRYDTRTGERTVLQQSTTVGVGPGYVSQPRPITYPTMGGQEAHALFYPPTNPEDHAPEHERPPLLVLSHGGPTSMALAAFSLEVLFWTSRGFAVADVNYGGSTGYGRRYRQRLNGTWGIVDRDDCVNAARYLVDQGLADPRRLAIRGGSAGGYTTLCALVFRDEFSAGASYYGVADCETLAQDTHKFESRYLDTLIGPYPAMRQVYWERSPIHFAERLSCPVILFQGLEDRIVPPSQAEEMVQALEARALPYAYLAFAGEQHGFRRAETIQRTLEAELSFYSRIFGFPLTDEVEPVDIQNLAR